MVSLAKNSIQIQVSDGQLAILNQLAEKREEPVETIIYRELEQLLAREFDMEDSAWELINLFESGVGDLAANHDHYLYDKQE